MQKIPTLFVRDESQRGHPVTSTVKPECQWVLDGEGIATRKLDGANVKIEDGQLLKRQKPKERAYDEAAYVPCRREEPADRWFWDAYDASQPLTDGIYEAVGPKIQRNEPWSGHFLMRVAPPDPTLTLADAPRTFDGLRDWLAAHTFEGLVFHHPDGRKAKIKRRDYGLSWPIQR